MSRNNEYTTGILLEHLCHQKYQIFIDIDLSRQTNTSIHQQSNFIGKLERDNGATTFLIAEKKRKTILNFQIH